MTKNGYFCTALFVLLALLSFGTAAAADIARGWFGMWLTLVSVFALIGATTAAYAAVGDYLMENEE